VQVEFYILETVDLDKARHEAWQDMSRKHRHWKYAFKDKIQADVTLKTINARVGANFLACYDTVDMEHLLERWCSDKDKVRHDLCYYFVYFH
jgi:hypothetical protein